MRLRWVLIPLSVRHLSACGEQCGADAAVDGVHVTSMLEDGSTRDVV